MSLEIIKTLRAETGAGMVDVKNALDEAGGDIEKAKDLLRKRGLKIAAKKQERTASEGIIHAYIHPPGKIGALVSLSCETDFVARNESFKALVHEIAKQIVAMSPAYIRSEDIPEKERQREREIHHEALVKEKKPLEMIDRILEGKMQKYYEQVCLLEQSWISDDTKKIKDLVNEHIAKLGEKIEVKQIARFSIS